jgi:hypothetical protein
MAIVEQALYWARPLDPDQVTSVVDTELETNSALGSMLDRT